MIPDILGFDQAFPWLLTALLGGYALGSVPYGLIIARLFKLGNLRTIGSGNIGATNVLRTGNKSAAILTLVCDAFKGTLAVLIFQEWGPLTAGLAGLGAFLGHCFPIWLRFQGGKGVATAFGVFLGWHYGVALVSAIVWIVGLAIWRRSSVSALLATVAGVGAVIWYDLFDLLPMTLMMALILILRHHSNILRIWRGEEPKI